MNISLKQFIDNLSDSGLMTLEDVQELSGQLPSDQQPSDGESLARYLVEANKLTSFQASLIATGQQQKLILGNYMVLEQIGRGGMGVVYKARHQRMKRNVAIKVLAEKLTNSETRLRRFHREVEAAARLVHPNIVTAFDADKDEKTFFLVMEFVDGKDMAEIVEEEGPLPVAVAVDYIIQTARGLEYAHGEGIIHRDIKPHNLLVTTDGKVKVLDLGLVSLKTDDDNKESTESLTANNQIIGTVDYMSPEQAEDVHHVDLRTDIYSLGCTLYRILTNKPPYSGKNAIQKLMAHRTHSIPSLRAERSDIPDLLDRAFRRMVAKRPEDRYQTMGEVIESMETCTLALISIGTNAPEQTVRMSSPFPQTDDATIDIRAQKATLTSTDLTASPSPGNDSISIQANQPSPVQRQRRRDRSSPWVGVLALAGILGLVTLAWFLSRPTQILLHWPVHERPGFDLRIDNKDFEINNSNPMSIPVSPGTHELLIRRRGYLPFHEIVNVKRRETVSLIPIMEAAPEIKIEIEPGTDSE
ncbi:MAG: serine/threonine-protein kinase [Pirellulaceae bacterium]